MVDADRPDETVVASHISQIVVVFLGLLSGGPQQNAEREESARRTAPSALRENLITPALVEALQDTDVVPATPGAAVQPDLIWTWIIIERFAGASTGFRHREEAPLEGSMVVD